MHFLKKFRGIILCFIIFFVVPFSVILTLNCIMFSENVSIFNNDFTLCGVNLGGLTLSEAESKLNNEFLNSCPDLKLELKYNNKTWVFQDSDFEVKSNIHTVLDSAYKTNRKGNYFTKIKNLRKIKKMGFNPQIAVRYVLNDIDKKIEDIASHIDTPAIDSTATYNKATGSFNITPSKKGVIVNKEKLLEDINNALLETNFVSLNISTLPVEPRITEGDIKKATKLQSSFTTNYASSNKDRKNNIKVATDTLSFITINPDEEFSFNATLGKRTTDRGYREANIIKDGTFVKGVGGGICQVSSTLYNALILAGIDVTEAHPHSLPVGYVQPAMDAMVSWNNADLKFKNSSCLPIFIVGSCNNNNLTFKVFGNTKEDNVQIKVTSEIVKKIPHQKDKIIPDTNGIYSDKIMFKGEYFRVKQAKDGYEAKAYKETYLNGKLQNKKLLRHATYNPQQGIVYEGVDKLPEGMTLPKDNEKIN